MNKTILSKKSNLHVGDAFVEGEGDSPIVMHISFNKLMPLR